MLHASVLDSDGMLATRGRDVLRIAQPSTVAKSAKRQDDAAEALVDEADEDFLRG